MNPVFRCRSLQKIEQNIGRRVREGKGGFFAPIFVQKFAWVLEGSRLSLSQEGLESEELSLATRTLLDRIRSFNFHFRTLHIRPCTGHASSFFSPLEMFCVHSHGYFARFFVVTKRTVELLVQWYDGFSLGWRFRLLLSSSHFTKFPFRPVQQNNKHIRLSMKVYMQLRNLHVNCHCTVKPTI